MPKPVDPSLIQNNSQIYRVYIRRLSNPADKDIFIASAGKLTTFLSDRRAYYAEAQQKIIETLEAARNSLKTLAPRVFRNPGSLDRSAIPDDKATLFDAVDKLANSVIPFVNLFTNKSMSNRLLSLMSSLGISLPPATTALISPDTPTQIPATSSTGHIIDLTASHVEMSSPIGTTSSDSAPMALAVSPTDKGPASDQFIPPVPTSVPSVAPIEAVQVKGSDNGAVSQSTSSQQVLQSPASELLQSSLPQEPVPGDVANPVPVDPNQTIRLPASSPSTLTASPSLHTQILSPASVPRVVPLSSQKVATTSSVMPSSTSPTITPQSGNPQSMPPSLACAGQGGVAPVSQVPLSQAQPPVQTPASAPPVSRSSSQQKPKPPPRRQSSGLNFLQLDLQIAREKKLKAAVQVAEQQKSGSAAQASSGPVPLTSTENASASATASLTSTATAGFPNTPAAPTSISTAPASATVQAAPARTPPLTGTTTVYTPAVVLSDSNTTPEPRKTQTASPSLVHRDLRQGFARTSSGASPRKLRITDRAPPPAPEPGSSSAPIVIDEEDGSLPTPTDAPIEVDSPTQAHSTLGKTTTVLDPPGETESEGDMESDPKSRPDQDTSRPLLSELEPPVTGTLRADVIATQSPSSPSISGPGPSFATLTPAIPVSGPSVPSAPENDKSTDVQLQQAKDDMVQDNVPEDSVDDLSLEITIIESPLGCESSAIRIGSTRTADDTEMTFPAPATTATTAIVTESATLVASPESIELSPEPNTAKPHGANEGVATISVAEASLASGKHRRSLTPRDDTRRVLPRKASIPESQKELPTIVLESDVVESASPALGTLDAEHREKGGSETVVDPPFQPRQAVSQTPSISSGKPSGSLLATPGNRPYLRTASLSDMDISRYSITPPPITVLGTRSGGSSVTNSRSTSPSFDKRPSMAGTEPVHADELEDEMVDELASLFGKEMRVICMDRAWDVPGELTWNFTLPQIDWDRVSQWAKAPENLDSDISRVRCITLACYAMQELEPYATQGGLTREQWFENVKPVPWANLPPNLWALINDKITVVFPPYVSPDDLFDLSPFLQLGNNKITFTQIDGMEDYVLVLHGHYPTHDQLVPLHQRWDRDRKFFKQLQWFARPFTIED